MDRLFEIADPAKHHLVLICDLRETDPYQANILRLANQTPWAGKVTVTGFQSAQRVGEILAAADAILFPFPAGAGEWNTSLIALRPLGRLRWQQRALRAHWGTTKRKIPSLPVAIRSRRCGKL